MRLRLSPTRRLGAIGLASLVAAGAVAGRTARIGEVGATEVVNDLPDPVVDALLLVMQLGTRPAILLVAVVAAVLVDRRRTRVAAAVLLAGGLAWATATVLKDVADRPRPVNLGADVTLHDHPTDPGFPSTHVSIATASLAAGALAARRRPAGPVAVGATVGLGRMAAGVHLPLDVVGGLGLGVLAAVVAVEIVDR